MESNLVRFPAINLARLKVLSYLPANVIFHKIAVLSKQYRKELPEWAILDQEKILTFKRFNPQNFKLPSSNSFRYALELIDGFTI